MTMPLDEINDVIEEWWVLSLNGDNQSKIGRAHV